MLKLVPRAAELGITQVGIGAPLSRRIPPEFPKELARAQLLECMICAVQICRPYQIQILMEPICSQATNLLNTTEETLRFVRACDSLGMVYDIYHACMMGEEPATVLPAIDKIKMVHIAHANHGRCLPTRDNVYRYLPYLQMLQELGYRGEIAVECNMSDITPILLEESFQALKMVSVCD